MTEDHERQTQAAPRVVAVQDDIVTIELPDVREGELMKNEVVYILPGDPASTGQRLKAEVLRVRGATADAQVFEDTAGVGIGDAVEQSGTMLSVELGPGLLRQVYDGLQNPLEELARDHGFFLPRGVHPPALDRQRSWAFTPEVRTGDRLCAGDVLGSVPEGKIEHKITIPFDERGEVEVLWIQEGRFTVDTPVARIRDAAGNERSLDMVRRWPVRRAIPRPLLRRHLAERQYPSEPLITGMRLIDTFFPLARGGTACIPGPFGAGKTVLQNLIARHAQVDLVIVVACGERAGEVVETITELPRLQDPRTGGSLMDRTVIICNTSSMPVAAREASIYTGITIGEYYRQMGLEVLLIADSTSRWAQAMRETSGRLEEIPGEEAFPAYLDSAIRGVYERAGVIRSRDGRCGSLTLIGTVSPAGGNFEEPVTQSTLGTVKCFLGLSSERAYKRFYPAVDPLISWSRYAAQLEGWYAEQLGDSWSRGVRAALDLLRRGDEVEQMMQVTGEEGITIEDFLTYHKARLLDLAFLQQDAFDPVDAATPLERQKASFELLMAIATQGFDLGTRDAVRELFTRLASAFKNWNYARQESAEFEEQRAKILALAGLGELGRVEDGEATP